MLMHRTHILVQIKRKKIWNMNTTTAKNVLIHILRYGRSIKIYFDDINYYDEGMHTNWKICWLPPHMQRTRNINAHEKKHVFNFVHWVRLVCACLCVWSAILPSLIHWSCMCSVHCTDRLSEREKERIKMYSATPKNKVMYLELHFYHILTIKFVSFYAQFTVFFCSFCDWCCCCYSLSLA